MRKQKKENPKKVGFGKMLAWNSRAVSQGIGLMVVGYLSIYCTDTLKMPAALVGVLLVVSKLLDGVTDVLAGFLVDKTHTKLGKGRPYELCILGMWLCIWLMFTCPPGFPIVAKSIWVVLMYALVNSVFYTFLQANNTVYMCRAFKYQEQYVSLSSVGSIISMVGVAAFNIAIPGLIQKYGVSAGGWSFLMACIAIPGAIIGMLRFIFIKETNHVDAVTGNGETGKIGFHEVKEVLTKNPYIYIVALILFICNLVTNMGVNVYYFTYVAHDLGMLGIVSAMQLLGIPVMAAVPAILKKISISRLMLIGCLISAFGYAMNFFAGGNTLVLGIAAILYGLGSVPITMLINLMVIECADYNEWKGNPRMEGTLGCVTGFATKVGSALGAGVLGVLLSASGYIGDENLIPDSAVMMIKNLFSTIPAVLWLIVAASLLLYKLDKLMPQIREENEARRADREAQMQKES